MINKFISKNIEVLVKHEFATQKEFAEFIEISAETISKIKKRGTLDFKTIDLIVNKYPNLSISWLIYNKGPMWINDAMKQEKKYNQEPIEENILQESLAISEQSEILTIPIKDYVEHLKTEIVVLENFINTKIGTNNKKMLPKIKKKLKAAGFKDVTTIYSRKRSNEIFDFKKGDFIITFDGINCILTQSGTGLQNKPLNEENIDEMIEYVEKNIQK